jgi:hypothetical protein
MGAKSTKLKLIHNEQVKELDSIEEEKVMDQKEQKQKKKYYGKFFVFFIFFLILFEYYTYVYLIFYKKILRKNK